MFDYKSERYIAALMIFTFFTSFGLNQLITDNVVPYITAPSLTIGIAFAILGVCNAIDDE